MAKKLALGLISERILEFIPESKKLIQNEIDSCLIHFPKRTLKIKFRKKFFVMSHFELDNLVADYGQKSRRKNHFKFRFRVRVLKEFKKSLNKIIGCDGAMSQIRKNLGLPDPEFKLGIKDFLCKLIIQAL